jgi:GTP-binding protein EngB required for normal cell division
LNQQQFDDHDPQNWQPDGQRPPKALSNQVEESTIDRDVPLKRYLADHPLAEENILLSEPAQYTSTIWGSETYEGIFFVSNKRCGLINNNLNSPFNFCEDILFYRAIGREDNQLFLRWIKRDVDLTDMDKDYYITIKLDKSDKVDKAYWKLKEIHYNNVQPNYIPDLNTAYDKINEGQFEFGLNILKRLSDVSYDTGILDLMIFRTLKYMGRNYEAATLVAKNFFDISILVSELLCTEYIWCEWHTGALRLLPDASSYLNNNYGNRRRTFLKLASSLEKHSSTETTKYLNELFLQYLNLSDIISQEEAYLGDQIILYSNNNTIETVKPSVILFINKLIRHIENKTTNLTEDEKRKGGEFIQYVFNKITDPDNYNYLEEIELSCVIKQEERDSIKYYLTNEMYSEIAILNYKPKNVETPANWTLEEISSNKNVWIVGSKIEECELQIKKLFARSRIEDIDIRSYLQLLAMINKGFSTSTLKNLDPSTILIFNILEIEVSIKNNDSNNALILIRGCRRNNYDYVGSLSEPILKYAEPILLFYEAWAYKSRLLILDALEKIPKEKPLLWVHQIGAQVLKEIESKRNIPANAMQAQKELKKLSDIMSSLCSKNLSTEIKENLTNYIEVILNGLESIQNCDQNKFTITEQQETIDNSFLKKASLLFQIFKPKNKIEDLDPTKYKWQKIKVALAGETSAGKTTFLNSMFSTNIFFVTQEEATGVPTEIHYGRSMRIDVLDENGKISQQLKVNDGWLSPDRSYIEGKYIDKIKAFMAKYTSVNSSEKNWVDKVIVYMPLVKLPESVILIDTPGYNATETRSQIAAKIISASNVCLFFIDARNALKGKELDVLQTIRKEVGKTFLILNKMDLVLGDDELDCDGADAADQTIDRVSKDLSRKLGIEQIQLYPICSLNKDQVLDEARRYVKNVDALKNDIFNEILGQHFDLLIDSLAKETITLSDSVIKNVDKAVIDFQEDKVKLERYIPKDPRMFEEEINERLHRKFINSRNIFIEHMSTSLNTHFKQLYDSFAYWIFQEVKSANKLKDEVKSKVEQYISITMRQVDSDRRNEIERIVTSLRDELIAIFQELYSQLPFRAEFETNSIVSALSNIKGITVSGDFGSINYTDDSLIAGGIGSGIGMAIGALILGPLGIFLGSIAGGFLGSLFGKSLDDIKKEVYDLFCKGVEELWDKITTTLDKDLSDDNMSSFINNINLVVGQQIDAYKNVINSEIKKHEEKGRQLQDEMDNLKYMAIQIQNIIEDLKIWRNSRHYISA